MARLDSDAINAILANNKQATLDDRKALEVTLEDVNSFGNRESLTEVFEGIAGYNSMLRERITFINDSLTLAIPFTRENLYLICAYSGNGKSTAAANVSHPLWKQGKKTLVLSNEESKQDILFRVACLELGYSFNEYKKGKMPADKQLEVARLFPEVSKYVKILDVNYKNGLTTKLEGVKNALKAVQESDYSCVMIDYFQLIKYSVEKSQASTYDVLDDLRIWLGQYIKRSRIPVVIFAQLHSIGKRNNKDLDSRIKACPTIYETATVVLEMIPNFEDQTTDWIIHKDRFGLQGKKISCAFDRGRYVPLTQEYKQRIVNNKLQELEKKMHHGSDEN
jgi:replicative DNA helicase